MAQVKREPISVDEWKLKQIRRLYECSFSLEQISNQVDIDAAIVKEIIQLIYGEEKHGERSRNLDAWKLKQISRMYEAGITIEEISEQIDVDAKVVRMLLKMLGYSIFD